MILRPTYEDIVKILDTDLVIYNKLPEMNDPA